jgi:hypothetical protein
LIALRFRGAAGALIRVLAWHPCRVR